MSNPYREEFISIYTQNITREGSQKLLAWLDTTDFYTARQAQSSTVPAKAAL